MSRDVPELLRQTADRPTRSLDPHVVIGRARRQRQTTRALAGLSAVVVLAVGSLVGSNLTVGDGGVPQVADQPDGVDGSDAALDVHDRNGDLDGKSFQDAVLEDRLVTSDEYEAAVAATVECIREAGYQVEFPDDDVEAVIDIAIDPAQLLTFSVVVPPGADTGDTVETCQTVWSSRVEQAWQAQLAPTAEERQEATRAALACGEERGQEFTGSDEEDAFRAVRQHGCRPWEDL